MDVIKLLQNQELNKTQIGIYENMDIEDLIYFTDLLNYDWHKQKEGGPDSMEAIEDITNSMGGNKFNEYEETIKDNLPEGWNYRFLQYFHENKSGDKPRTQEIIVSYTDDLKRIYPSPFHIH